MPANGTTGTQSGANHRLFLGLSAHTERYQRQQPSLPEALCCYIGTIKLQHLQLPDQALNVSVALCLFADLFFSYLKLLSLVTQRIKLIFQTWSKKLRISADSLTLDLKNKPKPKPPYVAEQN